MKPCKLVDKRRSRETWIEANGPIPDGLFVLHKCDVENCVELTHLWLGTQTENMKDMWGKGRGVGAPKGNQYATGHEGHREPRHAYNEEFRRKLSKSQRSLPERICSCGLVTRNPGAMGRHLAKERAHVRTA